MDFFVCCHRFGRSAQAWCWRLGWSQPLGSHAPELYGYVRTCMYTTLHCSFAYYIKSKYIKCKSNEKMTFAIFCPFRHFTLFCILSYDSIRKNIFLIKKRLKFSEKGNLNTKCNDTLSLFFLSLSTINEICVQVHASGPLGSCSPTFLQMPRAFSIFLVQNGHHRHLLVWKGNVCREKWKVFFLWEKVKGAHPGLRTPIFCGKYWRVCCLHPFGVENWRSFLGWKRLYFVGKSEGCAAFTPFLGWKRLCFVGGVKGVECFHLFWVEPHIILWVEKGYVLWGEWRVWVLSSFLGWTPHYFVGESKGCSFWIENDNILWDILEGVRPSRFLG